jgi:hypothetical protein
MLRPTLMSLAFGVVVCLTSANCGQNANLHDRIIAADTSKYCRLPDACFNPHVLAVETGYEVTTFLGSTAQHAHVAAKGLAKYLQSLPMQVWPRGPSIAISPTDVVTDQRAVEQNFYAAQQVCRYMGLEVQVFPGG